MKQSKTIKWGILGCGKIAHKFAADLQQTEGTILQAVASRSLTKAQAFAITFDAKKAYGSYEEFAKDADVNAVYIATPHPFHKEHTLLCLQHQKAVLCEKPFGMNAAEVDEMIATANQNDVLLMEALWTYFLPHYQFVLDIFKTKKYGELLELKADFGFKATHDTNSRLLNKKLGGGSLLDIGIYPIFAALSTLGMPKKIDAKATFFETGADASCDIIFEYENAKAFIKSTFLEETNTEAIFTFEHAVVKLIKRFHEPSSVTISQNNTEETLLFATQMIGYHFEIAHFNHLLREGKKESPLMSFAFSKNLIKLLDKVREIIGLEY